LLCWSLPIAKIAVVGIFIGMSYKFKGGGREKSRTGLVESKISALRIGILHIQKQQERTHAVQSRGQFLYKKKKQKKQWGVGRENFSKRFVYVCICMYICVCMYMYVYLYSGGLTVTHGV
jgi:hypothetical protein